MDWDTLRQYTSRSALFPLSFLPELPAVKIDLLYSVFMRVLCTTTVRSCGNAYYNLAPPPKKKHHEKCKYINLSVKSCK